MNEEIRKRFLELKIVGQRHTVSPEEKTLSDSALIEYLQSILKNGEVSDFEDIGFCYWNISDNYAFARNSASLFENHKLFHEHVITHNPSYLFWLVCDATQRFTLESGGYSEFWQSLYREAVFKNDKKDVCFAEFLAHRAALTCHPHIYHAKSKQSFAEENFEKFLRKASDTQEFDFYRIIFLSLNSCCFKRNIDELTYLCEKFFDSLALPKTVDNVLIGEWKYINTPFDQRKQAAVGINSAVNALIYNDKKAVARDLYKKALEFGMDKNSYIEKRINI